MERISKMWRSGLAMLLALCLLISAGPVTAFASYGDDIAAKYEMPALEGFVEKYVPAAYELAYTYVAESGYVELAQAKIDETVAYLTAEAAKLADELIPVVEAEIEALKPQAEELNKVLMALTAELDKKVAEKAAAVEAAAIEEIDAAIVKIEAAIDAVEAQIKLVNAEIVELNKALEELVAAVEAVAAQVEVVIENGKALADSIVALVETLKNTDELSSKAAAAAYGAAREVVLAAVETMDSAVELVDTQVADVIADVKAMDAQVVAVNESAVAALKAVNELPAEVLAAAAEAVEGTYAAVLAVAAETKGEIEALYAEYADEIAAKEAELKAILDDLDAHVAAKKAELEVAATAKVNELTTKYENEIAFVEAATKDDVAIIEAAINGDTAPLENRINELNAELMTLVEQNPELKAEIEAVKAEIAEKEALLAADAETLKAHIVKKNAELEAHVAEKKAQMKSEIEAVNAALKADVEAARAEVEAAVAAIKAEIAALEADLAAKAEALNAHVEAELAKLYAAKAEVEAAIDAAIAHVEEKMVVVNAMVEEVIAAVNAAFVRATTSDLALGRKSAYIALGDGTAAAKSYVDLVSARVKSTFPVEKFHNYAEAGNTVGAEIEKVAARPGIADAAVITIGFGNVTMLDNAIRNAGKVSYDWAKLVGAEMVPYVEEALAAACAKVAEAGLDATWTAKVASIVEGIAYAAVEYAVGLPQLIAEIRTVNTDAVIVVVGQYNPLAGSVLNIGGTTIDVSAYIDGFVAAVAAHGLGYALITGEAIFVNAPAVETSNTDKELTEDELVFDMVLDGFAALYPSEAGDLYIANQILAALNMAQYDSKNPFVDVHEGDWFYDAVLWAVEMGITNGTGDGTTFEPTTATTRAHIVTFLWRFAGRPEPKTTDMPFVDVPADDYFTKAVLWAAENGITVGTGDGTTFKPHEICTRAQIVTMLARYMNGTPDGSKNPFVDVAAGQYYTDAVLWAVQNGITEGVGDGTTFDPNGECWRAMVVTMLHRIWLQN